MYFSASYCPLALSLRKSFQYIPCSVVSTLFKNIFKLEGLPLSLRPWPAHWTSPVAGEISLTFIGRPLPCRRAAIGSFPQSKFLLSEINKTKPNPPTRKKNKQKEKEIEKKAKVLDHSAVLFHLSRFRKASHPQRWGKHSSQKRVFKKSHNRKQKHFSVCKIPMVCWIASS